MTTEKALEIIKTTDLALYRWITSNGRGISNQTIILYAEKLKGETK